MVRFYFLKLEFYISAEHNGSLPVCLPVGCYTKFLLLVRAHHSPVAQQGKRCGGSRSLHFSFLKAKQRFYRSV